MMVGGAVWIVAFEQRRHCVFSRGDSVDSFNHRNKPTASILIQYIYYSAR